MNYFQEAIALDPDFALAYQHLSYCYMVFCVIAGECCCQEYRETVEKTLEMDNALHEAHDSMGELLYALDRDWEGAAHEFRRSRELAPDFYSFSFTWYLTWIGLLEEAAEELEGRSQTIDPLSVGQQQQIAWGFYKTRKFDRALTAVKKCNELDPDTRVNMVVEFCYLGKGMKESAFSAFLSWRESEYTEEGLEQYRQAFGESGIQGVYQLLLDDAGEETFGSRYNLAAAYAVAGNKDAAFRELKTHYGSPSLILFATDARFDSLRSDPRFEGLLRKLKLPEEAIQRHLTQHTD
jgi:tetratricopeptide (TPR) repeat protein